jgi:hypothetical protein
MKNLITSLLYFLLIISVFNFSNCKKDSTDTFCSTNRTLISTISERTATIIYYQKYNRYGVRIDSALTGNIDSQIIGLTCDIPKELRTEGANVKVSGQLKKFNTNENISPQMAGDDLYYLEITQITKQ